MYSDSLKTQDLKSIHKDTVLVGKKILSIRTLFIGIHKNKRKTSCIEYVDLGKQFYMKFRILTVLISLSSLSLFAQDIELIKKHSFSVSELSDTQFRDFIQPRIQESQFVFLGEQHGIVEVGEATRILYTLGQPFGYDVLCIETDATAAKTITSFFDAKNPLATAKKLDATYDFSIPFYNNEEDIKMFQNVLDADGVLWGIDQSLMTQFRLNFEYLINNTKSAEFKSALQPLLEKAIAAFEKTVREKDFMAPYIFSYDDETHQKLLGYASTSEEKETLKALKKTKEIYGYNFSGQYYLNNEVRARHMKQNFMRYYKAAQQKETIPKVFFKLGGNHAARGLTRTRVYDIANLGAELAIMNGMESLHLLVMGVSGTQNIANPFEPEKSKQTIDTKDTLPKEFIDEALAGVHKYQIIDTKALRSKAHTFSKEVQKMIFAYDVVILLKDAKPLTSY